MRSPRAVTNPDCEQVGFETVEPKFADRFPTVIVKLFLVTVKVLVTFAAGEFEPSPSCEAVMLQVPTAIAVSVKPESVQTWVLFEIAVMVKPLEAEIYEERSIVAP